jgi:hypothetical protein
MAWSDPFWKPIKLNDGRVLSTLGDARELIATLPSLKQAEGHWQDADEMPVRAEAAPSARDDALAAVVLALKTEGLLECPATATAPQPSPTTSPPRSRSSASPSTAGPTGWRGQTW